jgi:hypothetical protein
MLRMAGGLSADMYCPDVLACQGRIFLLVTVDTRQSHIGAGWVQAVYCADYLSCSVSWLLQPADSSLSLWLHTVSGILVAELLCAGPSLRIIH